MHPQSRAFEWCPDFRPDDRREPVTANHARGITSRKRDRLRQQYGRRFRRTYCLRGHFLRDVRAIACTDSRICADYPNRPPTISTGAVGDSRSMA
jgi:hypothetical protein